MAISLPPDAGNRVAALSELGLDIAALSFLPILALVPHGTAPLIGVAGVLALGLAVPAGQASLRPLRGFGLLSAALILWGLVSAAWAVEPGRSLLIAARLSGLFAAGFALVAASPRITSPRRLFVCSLAGLGLALVLAEIQFGTGGLLTQPFFVRPFKPPQLNQIENGVAIVALPMAAILLARRRAIGALLLVIGAAAAVVHLVGTAGKFALGIAAGVAVLYYFIGRPLARATAVFCIVVILTAPLTFPQLARIPAVLDTAAEIKFSAWHRLMIWSFVGDRIAERPLFGWGLDAARSIPGGQQVIRLGAVLLPLHPHNAALQVWLELGIPGAVLFALLIAGIWFALANARWPPLFTAAAAGSLMTVLVASMGTYGVWQEWWIATLWFSLFLVLQMGRLASESAGAPVPVSPLPAPQPARSHT
jgi:exopolysaccharide production protein ExoQ